MRYMNQKWALCFNFHGRGTGVDVSSFLLIAILSLTVALGSTLSHTRGRGSRTNFGRGCFFLCVCDYGSDKMQQKGMKV